MDALRTRFRARRHAAALAVACASLTAPGVAGGASSCADRVLADWADGRIDGVYAIECYEAALASLPTDVLSYTNASADIKRALQARVAQAAAAAAQERPAPARTSSTRDRQIRSPQQAGSAATRLGGTSGAETSARSSPTAAPEPTSMTRPSGSTGGDVAVAAAAEASGQEPTRVPLPLLLIAIVCSAVVTLAGANRLLRFRRRNRPRMVA